MKRLNRHRKIDKQTASDLPKTFNPMFKGLVLFFDDALIKRNISSSAKLVYSGLYYSVPKKARYQSIASRDWVVFKKSKKELIQNLGIARSTFYKAINELIGANLIVVDYDKYNRSSYRLAHEMELMPGDIKAVITTEMLKRAFVRTNNRNQKTYSPYAKIVLGLLAQESRKDYKRVITTTAKEISEDFDIPSSTIYYLIRQFQANNTISLKRKEQAVLSLLLLDEYSLYQRKFNKSTSGTHPKKSTLTIKQKIPEEAPQWMDDFMNN